MRYVLEVYIGNMGLYRIHCNGVTVNKSYNFVLVPTQYSSLRYVLSYSIWNTLLYFTLPHHLTPFLKSSELPFFSLLVTHLKLLLFYSFWSFLINRLSDFPTWFFQVFIPTFKVFDFTLSKYPLVKKLFYPSYEINLWILYLTYLQFYRKTMIFILNWHLDFIVHQFLQPKDCHTNFHFLLM